jgi:hypothetical protein
MDRKEEAKARLEAIKKEVVELEKIIAGGLTYSGYKLYVGLFDGGPYIMAGSTETGYRFQQFGGYPVSGLGWCKAIKDPQECLDYHTKVGFEIHEFSDVEEGFGYFLSKHKK